MSEASGKMPLSRAMALSIAMELKSELAPYCEHIEIVGSLRRNKDIVNDIDLLVIPRFEEKKDDSLFEDAVSVSMLNNKLAELCWAQRLAIDSSGEKVKRFHKKLLNETVQIDIYIATQETWWTLLLIRTGSREHNIALCRRAIELHMQLKADGTGLIGPSGTPLQIRSEEEIFAYLNMEYRRPEMREQP